MGGRCSGQFWCMANMGVRSRLGLGPEPGLGPESHGSFFLASPAEPCKTWQERPASATTGCLPYHALLTLIATLRCPSSSFAIRPTAHRRSRQRHRWPNTSCARIHRLSLGAAPGAAVAAFLPFGIVYMAQQDVERPTAASPMYCSGRQDAMAKGDTALV